MNSNAAEAVCRLCLSIDVRMYAIAGSSLQSVFEKLTNSKLYSADRRPSVVCYICHAHLKNSLKLMKMSAETELALTALLEKYDQITKESISLIDYELKDLRRNLSLSKPDWIDTTIPPATVEVKIEPEVDNLFVSQISFDVETNFLQSDVLIDHTYSAVEIKVEDSFECSDVTIVEVKTEEEAVVDGADNEWDDLLQAPNTEELDVDIENLHNSGDSFPLDENHLEREPILLQKDKSKTVKTEGTATDTTPKLKKKAKKARRKPTKNQRYQPKERLFECSVCQSRFYQEIHLRTHTRIHTGEKPYTCNICQRSFSDKSSLNSHAFVHSGERPHECNICNQRFYKKYHLNRHLMTHSGNKPFECNICHHQFFDKSGLECHLRIHSEVKPFECDLCHRAFNYKHVLMKHMRVHTGEKPHHCVICNKHFARRFNLQTHLKRMHDWDTFNKKSRLG